MELDLTKTKKVFFIGIGGIGISALAQLMRAQGIEVSGVNDDESPATLNPLRTVGVSVLLQKDYSTLPEADAYVYSDAWLYRGPEIIAAARATGKPVMSYFETLGGIAKKYRVVAIAGTHGKTTTTAMTAEALIAAELDPTVIVGSFVKTFNSNFRGGKSDVFVVEADEYMRHFLNFDPFITVITNIEADHLDCYKDLADIEDAFRTLVGKTSGVVVCDPSDPSVARVIAGSTLQIVDYTKLLDKVPQLSVPGEHNRKDAAAALAVSQVLGADISKASGALAAFAGTWRRLEKKGVTKMGTIVYDDYAHHPTEARASLQALRELYPRGEKKITVVFQPHLYSRTKALFDDFVMAFNQADSVYFLPIYFAREDPDPSISSDMLAEAVSQYVPARAFPDFAGAEAALAAEGLGPNDVLVTMGAGEAYKIGEKLL